MSGEALAGDDRNGTLWLGTKHDDESRVASCQHCGQRTSGTICETCHGWFRVYAAHLAMSDALKEVG